MAMLAVLTNSLLGATAKAAPVPGVTEKKLTVLAPVLIFIGIICAKKAWKTEPLFKPMLGWRIILGVISFMYIAAFWWAARARMQRRC